MKQEIAAYFDGQAAGWDTHNHTEDAIINAILDNAEVGEGMDILDVACGTGVLFPWYQARRVGSVTAVDISPEMAGIAAEKARGDETITVLRGDIEDMKFDRKFDRIVVYNALPHFPAPKYLVKRLAMLLKEDGRLTIAHGAGRQQTDLLHQGLPEGICRNLIAADELKKYFDPHFHVEIMVDNQKMYQVSGVKRDPLAHSHCGVTHSHGGITHTHSHGDEAHTHAPAAGATPIEELLALMKYLVSHNDAHAQEVADLAAELLTAGKNTAYDEIMDAVSDFDMVNAKLDSVLCRLTVEEY